MARLQENAQTGAIQAETVRVPVPVPVPVLHGGGTSRVSSRSLRALRRSAAATAFQCFFLMFHCVSLMFHCLSTALLSLLCAGRRAQPVGGRGGRGR